MNEGTDPAEGPDEELVNRRAAALHEEAARLAERDRLLDLRAEKLDEWEEQRRKLCRLAVRLLTAIVESQQETARRLMRLDDRLADLEQRYPDAKSDLPSCRVEVMAENRRLISYAESVQETAAIFAIEPEKDSEEPDGTTSQRSAADASTPSEPGKQPAAYDAHDTHIGSLLLIFLPCAGIIVLGVARLFIHPAPGWMILASGTLSGILLGRFLERLVRNLHHTREQRTRK